MTVSRASELAFRPLPGRRSADPFKDVDTEGVSVRVVRIEPGPRSLHRHPASVELIYVAEGRGASWQDGVLEPVGPGDVLLIPRGVPHATLAARDSPLVLVCFFPHPDLQANLEELVGEIRL